METDSGSFCGIASVGNSELPLSFSFRFPAPVSLRILFFTTLAFLTNVGCTPYVFGGLGYSAESGFPNVEETGPVANFGVGLEFENGVSCEFRHRSMIIRKPEIVTNDAGCEYKKYFGKRR